MVSDQKAGPSGPAKHARYWKVPDSFFSLLGRQAYRLVEGQTHHTHPVSGCLLGRFLVVRQDQCALWRHPLCRALTIVDSVHPKVRRQRPGIH